MAKSIGRLPVSKADVKMAKKHLKASIKLEKSKIKDHLKAAKSTKNPKSKAYNISHANGHKKDIKARLKYAKKVSKVKAK